MYMFPGPHRCLQSLQDVYPDTTFIDDITQSLSSLKASTLDFQERMYIIESLLKQYEEIQENIIELTRGNMEHIELLESYLNVKASE